MKLQLIITVLILTSVLGCQKDNEIIEIVESDDAATITPANYHPLTIGSYWIYKLYLIDTNDVEKYLRSDTTRIIGDTIIDGHQYAIKKGTSFGINFTAYLRNTPDYLLDKNGIIRFSGTNFTDILYTIDNSPIFMIYHLMDHKDTLIIVPAGSFTSLAYKYIWHWISKPELKPKFEYDFYSEGVGIVQRKHFFGFGNPNHEERLVDYLIVE